jgi:hypothetical protein
MAPLPTAKRLAFSFALFALLWGLTELACWGGLWALQRFKQVEYKAAEITDLEPKNRRSIEAHLADPDTYLIFDADLGWTVRPNARKGIYQANSMGVRASREYDPSPPAGKVRVAAFGDSFTHASGVPNGFTWEEKLEELDPGLEVMNFGIPGSDPGQGLVRYRKEGIPVRPAVVLIGMMSENINRMVNTFRPFYFARSGLPFSKPRFEVRGGKLVLIPNPIRSLAQYRDLLHAPERMLPRLGEHDYFYHRYHRRSSFDFLPSVRFARVVGDQYLHHPILLHGVYNVRSEAYEVTLGVLQQFYREALENGSLPVILLFPQRSDVRGRQAGRPPTYRPLLDELRRQGLRVVDLGDGFARYDPRGQMLKKRFVHYPEQGNAMVGRAVYDYFVAESLTTPESARAAYERTARAAGVSLRAHRPGGSGSP